MIWIHRWNRAEYFDLFIADSVAIQPSGRLHSQKSYDLKHVVFYHVADRPGVIVELAPSLNPELFSHSDLHTLDVIAVPDRLRKLLAKRKNSRLRTSLFTEIVVDPKDFRFRKHRMKCGIQLLSRGKIVSKGLFDNDSPFLIQLDFARDSTTLVKRLGGIAR